MWPIFILYPNYFGHLRNPYAGWVTHITGCTTHTDGCPIHIVPHENKVKLNPT